MEIGDRVNTPHGIGTIMDVEEVSNQAKNVKYKTGRFGVKHDFFPTVLYGKMYRSNIIYYFPREINIIK